jgi:hypothetical protein
MSGLAEFKEKTFEKYFGFELARQTNVTFSPDQCDEEFLGFDDAFLLPWRRDLFSWWPSMRRRRRQWFSGISIREIDTLAADISKRMPRFKFNLFVQYKRPHFIDHHRGKEWLCWGTPYFRFDITPHQQKLLADLEAQASGRAAIVYASAAFWQNSDLYSHSLRGTVVSNSNIASVARLSGHGRFSYQKPGSFGRAHSDPVDIESRSISQVIEIGLQQAKLPFNRHIKLAALNINKAIAPDEPQAAMLDQVRRLILGDEVDAAAEEPADSFVYAVATIVAFSELFDVSYYAMG